MQRSVHWFLGTAAAALLAFGATAPAKAAALFFDDRGETGTISAADFEGCFSVNGSNVECGLARFGGSGSVKTGESFTYSGSWIDLGQSWPGTFAQIALESVGSDSRQFISDENVYTVSTNGGFGTITGQFCSDSSDIALCVIPTNARISFTGESADFSQPFLSASWASDVPEPASGLLLSGLAGLGWLRRRRSTKTA
jgi:hypothetical protein